MLVSDIHLAAAERIHSDEARMHSADRAHESSEAASGLASPPSKHEHVAQLVSEKRDSSEERVHSDERVHTEQSLHVH